MSQESEDSSDDGDDGSDVLAHYDKEQHKGLG